MKLSSFLDKKLIFLDYHFDSYKEIINFVSEQIALRTPLVKSDIAEALQKRENLGTTFFGHHLALPHGYVDHLEDIAVLFIRLDHVMEVRIDSSAYQIKYVFAILTSKNKAQLYLKVLSTIAQLVVNSAYILDNARTAQDLITQIDLKGLEVEESLTAADLIFTTVKVHHRDTVARAVDLMHRHNVTFLPVVNEHSRLLGVIDLADLFIAAFQDSIDTKTLSMIHDVSSDMTGVLMEPIRHFWENEEKRYTGNFMRSATTYTIHENASYIDIVLLMVKYHHRYFVVVDNSWRVKGMIDTSDIVHKMIRA